MTFLILGEEFYPISTREFPSVTPLPVSRVEPGWVVSVGVEHVASGIPDTTHNPSPVPPQMTFAGGASDSREAGYPSPPGMFRFPFRIG